jgi:hypothetical protein
MTDQFDRRIDQLEAARQLIDRVVEKRDDLDSEDVKVVHEEHDEDEACVLEAKINKCAVSREGGTE